MSSSSLANFSIAGPAAARSAARLNAVTIPSLVRRGVHQAQASC